MIEQKQREIARKILEALYDAWERQTDICVNTVQKEGGWNKTVFRTVVNKLDKQQGLIKSTATSDTFQLTPNGIFYAEKHEIVPNDQVEWHEKIRHHILRELAHLRSEQGSWADRTPKELALGVAGNVPIKRIREIMGDLLLLVEIGDVEGFSAFKITDQYFYPEVGRQDTQFESQTPDRRSADFLIVWDPEVVGRDDYALLITALGDLVRSEGGLGLQLRRAISIQAEGTILLEKHAIAPSAARHC